MMVDGVIPPGGGAATRSMEAGQNELVAAGAMRESAAADRLMWGQVAHEGHRMAVQPGGHRLERLLAQLAQGVVGAADQLAGDRQRGLLAAEPGLCLEVVVVVGELSRQAHWAASKAAQRNTGGPWWESLPGARH